MNKKRNVRLELTQGDIRFVKDFKNALIETKKDRDSVSINRKLNYLQVAILLMIINAGILFVYSLFKIFILVMGL